MPPLALAIAYIQVIVKSYFEATAYAVGINAQLLTAPQSVALRRPARDKNARSAFGLRPRSCRFRWWLWL